MIRYPGSTQRALYVQCTYIVRTLYQLYVQCTYIVRTVPAGYIQKSLKLFNFSDSTIKWVKSLQLNSNSKILHNGHFSNKIDLGRGYRQGDSISPYLFVLAAEFLAEAIRSNHNMTGIKIYEQEHKVSQYADGTSLLSKAHEQKLRECMAILTEFESISGQ